MEEEKICCGKCLHFVAENEPCGKQPLGIPFPYTEFCSEFEKKCCGNCCWFYGETTEGDGVCANCPVGFDIVHCDSKHCDNYISRQKVRHSAAILAQYRRFQRALTLDRGNSIPGVLVPFDGDKISEAIEIITRYVNVITKKV